MENSWTLVLSRIVRRTLFAHGFMLSTFQNAGDQVVVWLDRTVGECLDAESPTFDYSWVVLATII